MSALKKKVLVLGVGNILCRDDGLGPVVVRRLEQRCSLPGVDFLDGGTLGLDLLAYLDGYSHLVLVDAVDLGRQPGQIFRWEEVQPDLLSRQVSFHQVGVRELLTAAKLLGHRFRVTCFGVQAADLSWGMELSPPVAEALPALEEAVLRELQRLTGSG
ncbi:HyaD/HybD family hydrogenase maturation endopeptidase [Calderihabitans maritimus]|uniref:Hydrogenase maturation protease family protein n=1 Tax=Calderihabitans maritimus TaxID=1246530 RepID=A0A1Z5HN26_9FIRM|nr:HyaD/HybD family hydrogenase maturation endopeptidase [Calderihabitans maritimus]GAW90926.1 hydrogenase maturation protease family protein [Calderihabitans maritimus]